MKIDDIVKLDHKGFHGEFKLIKISGGRYHLFFNSLVTFTLTKAELNAAISKYDESKTVEIAQSSDTPTGVVKKIHKALGTKTQTNSENKVSTSEFDQMKNDWIRTGTSGYSDDYKPVIIEKVKLIEIGGMYYYGSRSNDDYDAYIVDGVYKKPHRYRKERKEPDAFEYYLKVRQWDYIKDEWGPIGHRTKGYEYEINLEEFAKSAHFPRLSKNPKELWEEAENALLNNDVEKYAMDQALSNDGPDTQLMHVGSKESLMAVQKDLESKRAHAVAIQSTMTMVIEQKKRALERVKDKMNAMLIVFEKQIRKIMRVITTIELYLGISEEIVQIQEGPTANTNEPICIRQGLMFMDEEVGDPWDDGQGLEWDAKGVAAFDDWLTRNENYKKVLPEKKGIAAFQARREVKTRANHGNPFANLGKMEADMTTFLLIRNGDNLYRLITDKIAFRPRLFPKRNELQRLFDYWKYADAIEEKNGGKNTHIWSNSNDKNGEDFESLKNSHQGSDTADAKEFAEDNVFFYKMRITLFQGLIDRTTILHPLKEGENIKLFNTEAQEKGLVRLIYDDELTLPTGRKSFWAWIMDMNSRIDYGSRIVLSHNWGFKVHFGHNEMEKYQHDDARETHSSRLDDRYGDGKNWSHLPPNPKEGMYFVKKGEKWKNEPVWIENPWHNPDLMTTQNESRYNPSLKLDEKPSNPKKYYGKDDKYRNNYHVELNPRIKMSHAEQIAYFGKVVEKAWGIGSDSEAKDGVWMHGIFKNPQMIHKCTMVPKKEWDNGEYVETGELEAKFEYHDVKHNFKCIRYNPKDTVGEYRMIRTRYDDEPSDRKMNLSWKIFNDDAFIINYDEIKIEDIDFYLNSRVDRRHYIFMMPLLWKVRTTLLEERESEVNFKKLVAGEVFKSTGVMPTAEQLDSQVENWKKDLKWKRAISHDDEKALRMIVQKLIKQLK